MTSIGNTISRAVINNWKPIVGVLALTGLVLGMMLHQGVFAHAATGSEKAIKAATIGGDLLGAACAALIFSQASDLPPNPVVNQAANQE